MNRRMSKAILCSLIGIILIAVTLALVNEYVFSITGLVSEGVGLCEYKGVSLQTENGYPQKLSFPLDPQRIAAEMRKNTEYVVDDGPNGVVFSRRLGAAKYNLILRSHHSYTEHGYAEFDLNTYDYNNGYPNGNAVGGEKCTTPSRVLRDNVFTIIDDLPLTKEEKDEMKQHVHVVFYSSNFLKFF